MAEHIMTEARNEQLAAARLKRWEGKTQLERRAEMQAPWAGLRRWLETRAEDVQQAREKAKEVSDG